MTRESINKLILEYESYANRSINLIASENYPSPAIRKALSSLLVGKYAEGYPGKRYYAGNLIIDKIERETQNLAKELFNTNYFVNVQAHSGSIANQAILNAATTDNNKKILSLKLSDGGHLSHGAPVSIIGKNFNIVNYYANPKSGKINYSQIAEIAKKEKPKVIICGFTSYPYAVDFATFAKITKSVNAYLLADISHIVALIAMGLHPSPFGYADFIMTTTHKSLAGPRGALIFSKNQELSNMVDRCVFPLLQGGPHMHSIAGIGIALNEAKKNTFKIYASAIIDNIQALSKVLTKNTISHSGSENHLLLINTKKTFGLSGDEAQTLLEEINIWVNKNSLPGDISPIHPSGIRIGSPAMTKRGMKQKQFEQIAEIIIESLRTRNKNVTKLKSQISDLAKEFPAL